MDKAKKRRVFLQKEMGHIPSLPVSSDLNIFTSISCNELTAILCCSTAPQTSINQSTEYLF